MERKPKFERIDFFADDFEEIVAKIRNSSTENNVIPQEQSSVLMPTPMPNIAEQNSSVRLLSDAKKADNISNGKKGKEKSVNQKKKSKTKKLILIISLILVVLLLTAAGIWYFCFYSKQPEADVNRTDFHLTLKELIVKMNEVRATLPSEYQREDELDPTQFLASTTTSEITEPSGRTCMQYIYENTNLDGIIIIIRLINDTDNFDSQTAKVASVVIKFPQSSYSGLIKKGLGLQAQVALATDDTMTFEKFKTEVEPFISEKINSDSESAFLRCNANSYGEKCYETNLTLHVWAGESYFATAGYNEEETLAFNEVERNVTTYEGQNSQEDYSGKSVEVSSALWHGNFADALATNSDTVAWIAVDGTNITGPVLQSRDNDYYLTRTIYKKYSRFGSRYVDYRCNVDPNNQSQNVTVYGHFSDEGIIFAKLHKYKDLNFFKQHAVIEFSTPDRVSHYKVFAVFITNTLPSHGTIFEYRDPEYATQQDFLNFTERVKRRSIISTDVDIKENDKILTLSTCTREFKQARLVVMARKLRDDESLVANTANYGYNPNPLYPDIWYKTVKKSAKKPYYPDEP